MTIDHTDALIPSKAPKLVLAWFIYATLGVGDTYILQQNTVPNCLPVSPACLSPPRTWSCCCSEWDTGICNQVCGVLHMGAIWNALPDETPSPLSVPSQPVTWGSHCLRPLSPGPQPVCMCGWQGDVPVGFAHCTFG